MTPTRFGETGPRGGGRPRRSVPLLATIVLLGFVSLLGVAGDQPAAADAAGHPPGETPGGVQTFSLPGTGGLVRGFDPPEHTWLAGHRGVDLAADTGEPVRASGDGIIAHAGVVVDRPVVSIDHPVGIRTTYEPVAPSVSRGEAVSAGQIIGVVHRGNAHCPDACLHWGARIGTDTYIDPLRLLAPPTIRLYPPVPW